MQDRPAAAPVNEPWKPDFKLFNNPPFHSGVAAIGSLIFAYGGIPAMFSVIAEMKDPRDFKKSLAFAQTTLTVTYLVSLTQGSISDKQVVGVVVYRYCGSYVSNPALGSAGVLMKKVCYGLALPGVLVSTVLITHVCPGSVDISSLLTSSSLQSSSSSAFSVDQNTLQIPLQLIGLPGWEVSLVSLSCLTSLPALCRFSVASFRLSVVCSFHSCRFNLWG